MPWWRAALRPLEWTACIVGTSLFIVVLILVFLPLAWARDACDDARFRRTYRARGRLISRKDLQQRLDQGEGTLLWDADCGRLFWTPDRVRERGPRPACRTVAFYSDFATQGFEDWCRRCYLDEKAGSAFAVAISRGRSYYHQSARWKPQGGDSIVLGLSHAEVCAVCACVFRAVDPECPRCETRSLRSTRPRNPAVRVDSETSLQI